MLGIGRTAVTWCAKHCWKSVGSHGCSTIFWSHESNSFNETLNCSVFWVDINQTVLWNHGSCLASFPVHAVRITKFASKKWSLDRRKTHRLKALFGWGIFIKTRILWVFLKTRWFQWVQRMDKTNLWTKTKARSTKVWCWNEGKGHGPKW